MMIDDKPDKVPTRFVVVREFKGPQSMEDVFGANLLNSARGHDIILISCPCSCKGDKHEQEKTIHPKGNCPLLPSVH